MATGSGSWTSPQRSVRDRFLYCYYFITIRQVLEKSPDNSKAVMRRAKALLELGMYLRAEADVEQAAKLCPGDGERMRMQGVIAEWKRRHDMQERERLRGMFQ